MKYIRTKDGIFEIINENETFYKCKCNMFVSKDIFYHKDKIADTIEELCDEFVSVGISGIPYGLKQLVDKEDYKYNKDFLISLVKIQEYEIYGAIWTEKGLIYVAKLNEKGELELL